MTLRYCLTQRVPKLGSTALLFAAVLAFSGTATANKIKGRVENYRQLINPVWEEARDPKRKLYSFREIVPTVPAPYRRMFAHIPKELCLAALASSAQQASRAPVLIRVGGGRTTPVTIVVAPHTRLQFKNTDPFNHQLYGVKDGKRVFALNLTGKGAAAEATVPEPGSYEVRDESAPSLRMWIVAEPNVSAIAYPSMKGEFGLTVEPGEYTLRAFFSGKPVGDSRTITVGNADADISKDPIKVAGDQKKSSDKDQGDKKDTDSGQDEKAADQRKAEKKK